MMKKLRIHPENRTLFIPKDAADDGYVGDVDVLMNALTITVIKPGATLEQVLRSLEIVKDDVRLRMQSMKTQGSTEGGALNGS